jgi:protein KRI1
MSEFKLTINKEFSEKFNRAKEREERETLQAKYGNVNESSLSSSSSESEDDDGKDITEGTDRTIYRILSALQSKDSRCYDPNYKFFSDKSDEESEREEDKDKAKQSTKTKKESPMFLKDYEREVIVKCKGKLDDMSETSEEEDETKETACYYEQQKEFQMSFMKAGAGNEEDADDSEGLVNIKVSSLDEKKKREEDGYVEWLKGQKNVIDESLAKDLVC